MNVSETFLKMMFLSCLMIGFDRQMLYLCLCCLMGFCIFYFLFLMCVYNVVFVA